MSDEQHHDTFARLYARDQPAYGMTPSAEIEAFLSQCPRHGAALDLGAGAGRNALALAHRGLDVHAVDVCDEGLARLGAAAHEQGVANRIDITAGDVRDLRWGRQPYDVIVAATCIDHFPRADLPPVWAMMIESLKPDGVMFVEVHTTEDPGSPTGYGAHSGAPISESAVAVEHYFYPNELLELATPRLRVLRYEERMEWDHTHGHPHRHGKATLLAVRRGQHPRYYGFPTIAPPGG